MTERSTPASPDPADYAAAHGDIVALLEAARRAAARSVNALMTASYWEIGRRIVDFEQGGQDRAAYGAALLKRLSGDLTTRFGRGFGVVNLQQMRNFYLAWPAERIYQTVSDKLSSPGISQTPSAKSLPTSISESLSRNFIDLPTLAKVFPLPWSAYVRLLSQTRRDPRGQRRAAAGNAGAGVCESRLKAARPLRPRAECHSMPLTRALHESGQGRPDCLTDLNRIKSAGREPVRSTTPRLELVQVEAR